MEVIRPWPGHVVLVVEEFWYFQMGIARNHLIPHVVDILAHSRDGDK